MQGMLSKKLFLIYLDHLFYIFFLSDYILIFFKL